MDVVGHEAVTEDVERVLSRSFEKQPQIDLTDLSVSIDIGLLISPLSHMVRKFRSNNSS